MYLCITRGIDFAFFYDFVYCILELFRQCGILCFSIIFWNCSDSVVFFVFLLYFGTVPTVWYFVFFYCILELFRQCCMLCFSIVFWNCSDSVVFCVFHFIYIVYCICLHAYVPILDGSALIKIIVYILTYDISYIRI